MAELTVPGALLPIVDPPLIGEAPLPEREGVLDGLAPLDRLLMLDELPLFVGKLLTEVAWLLSRLLIVVTLPLSEGVLLPVGLILEARLLPIEGFATLPEGLLLIVGLPPPDRLPKDVKLLLAKVVPVPGRAPLGDVLIVFIVFEGLPLPIELPLGRTLPLIEGTILEDRLLLDCALVPAERLALPVGLVFETMLPPVERLDPLPRELLRPDGLPLPERPPVRTELPVLRGDALGNTMPLEDCPVIDGLPVERGLPTLGDVGLTEAIPLLIALPTPEGFEVPEGMPGDVRLLLASEEAIFERLLPLNGLLLLRVLTNSTELPLMEAPLRKDIPLLGKLLLPDRGLSVPDGLLLAARLLLTGDAPLREDDSGPVGLPLPDGEDAVRIELPVE